MTAALIGPCCGCDGCYELHCGRARFHAAAGNDAGGAWIEGLGDIKLRDTAIVELANVASCGEAQIGTGPEQLMAQANNVGLDRGLRSRQSLCAEQPVQSLYHQ